MPPDTLLSPASFHYIFLDIRSLQQDVLCKSGLLISRDECRGVPSIGERVLGQVVDNLGLL